MQSQLFVKWSTAGVRINKVQISCAIELDDPSDEKSRRALATFAEPRYLHQTFGRAFVMVRLFVTRTCLKNWHFIRQPDWQEAEVWRVHFHVPVDADRLGPLRTTRPELIRGLEAIQQLPYEPHLEVETYTWPVLPGVQSGDVISGMARELVATRNLLVAGDRTT